MTGGDRPAHGGLAQLARAFDLHSKGHRFDSDILHLKFEPMENVTKLVICVYASMG